MAKINVKLLRKVQKHILAEPKRVNMGTFIYRKKDEPDMCEKWPACGTVACIAGWAVTLSQKKEMNYNAIPERARRLLGLDWEQANYLFYDRPCMVMATPQTAAHAQQTAKLIDHFIAIKGKTA
jgi:hypothetical protein